MPKTVKLPKDVGNFHAHFGDTNAKSEHKHEGKKGSSFDCEECATYIKEAQELSPDNFVGYEVS